jgi:hypothetical protein
LVDGIAHARQRMGDAALCPPRPVPKFSICVNLRQSARASGALYRVVPICNSGFGCLLPLSASRPFHYGTSTIRKWLMLSPLQQSAFFRIFPLTSILISYIIARVMVRNEWTNGDSTKEAKAEN